MSDDDYYDSSEASDDEYFEPWEVAQDTQTATGAIAERIAQMQKLYRETIALASTFDVRVSFSLESENNRGHNRGEHIYWTPSSQHC